MSDPWEPSDDPFSDDPPPSPDPEDPFSSAGEPPEAARGGAGVRFSAATGEVFDEDDESMTLDERVKRVEEAVADIAELLRLAPGGPWVWHMLEHSARRTLAEKLVEWVQWLSTRYLANLSQEKVFTLPPRWFTNPVLVELMTALYVGYISVYSPRQRTPSIALIEWHERGLWPTLNRIKTLGLVNRSGQLVSETYEVKTDDDAVDFITGPDEEKKEGPSK